MGCSSVRAAASDSVTKRHLWSSPSCAHGDRRTCVRSRPRSSVDALWPPPGGRTKPDATPRRGAASARINRRAPQLPAERAVSRSRLGSSAGIDSPARSCPLGSDRLSPGRPGPVRNETKEQHEKSIAVDGLSRELGAVSTRRSVVRLLGSVAAVGAVAVVGHNEADAKRKRGKKKKGSPATAAERGLPAAPRSAPSVCQARSRGHHSRPHRGAALSAAGQWLLELQCHPWSGRLR